MVVPAGGDIALFNNATKELTFRVALGFARPAWTADVMFDFTALASFDHSLLWTTQFGGAHPELDATDGLLIKQYGGPPHEKVITRKVCFPTDPDLAFGVRIKATFPESDPVYSQVITVGGLDQSFGVEAEPMQIVQGGSAFVGGANVGKEFVHGGGTIDSVGFAFSGTQHTYEVEWDPDAPGGAGSEKLTIKRDTVTIVETSAAGSAVRPRYVAIGDIMPTRTDADGNAIPGLGSSGTPVTTMMIESIEIYELGDGNETQTYPAWTEPEDGNDIDTAPERELFIMDGVTWAKLPVANILGISGQKSRTGNDTLSLTLGTPDPEDGDTVNRFQGDVWVGNILLVDAMVTAGGSDSDWYRLGVFEITESRERGEINISATDRPMYKLDSYLARNYLGLDADSPVVGEVDGTNIDYTIMQILEDLVSVADVIHGGNGLGPTETAIQAKPDIVPQALDSGGQSLVTFFNAICDRLVLESWRKYRTTGDERYGQIVVNLWTFGSGTAGYTFRGQGSTNSNIVEPGIELREQRRAGTGQAFYRPDAPQLGPDLLSLTKLPVVGQFPSSQYPAEQRVLNDSLSGIATTGLSVIQGWDNASGTDQFGGVAKFRFMKENGFRRVVAFPVENHPWLEPTDEIGLDDPDRTGLDETVETWVVNTITWSIADMVLRQQVEASTSDWANAVERTG